MAEPNSNPVGGRSAASRSVACPGGGIGRRHCRGTGACIARRQGKISLLALIFVLLLVVLAGLIGNSGHTVRQKLAVQHASDAVAFSSAMWMSRGMNAVTASNHLVGEATALSVIHESLGGSELRLGLRTRTNENQQLDAVIRSLSAAAPIGRIPSTYVPIPLTNLDRNIIQFVTKRTSPPAAPELKAFAMLYDSRMTLKRELLGWLAAKSLANVAFVIPPPLGIIPAVAAYGVHIAATSQIVLIGKEWLLLQAIEQYAVAASKVQAPIFESQLIPTLCEFAGSVAGLELSDGEPMEIDSLLTEPIDQALQSTAEEHRVDATVFPLVEDLRLPVEFEPLPTMQTFDGPWPEAWGTDAALPLPNLEKIQRDMEDELDDALGEIDQRSRRLERALTELSKLRDEIDARIAAGDVEGSSLAELRQEQSDLRKTIDDIEQELAELSQAEGEIAKQRDELERALQSLTINESQNLSLRHIPEWLDPNVERNSQWVRATLPNVDALRAPLLGMLLSQLPKSHAADHFTKWTNRYTLIKAWQFRSGYRLNKTGPAAARWDAVEQPLAMLVMPDSYRNGQAAKGNELWTRATVAGKNEAEQLFTFLGVSQREFSPLFSKIIYPAPHDHGLTTFAQSIVYNANPQRAGSGSTTRQAQIGWDTLNWDGSGPPIPEWGAEASQQDRRWPWQLFDGLDHAPKVTLNWQAKLVPVTRNRLQAAVDDADESSRSALQLAIDHPTLLSH